MKIFNYSTLIVCLLALVTFSCAPKYGAHFNKTKSDFYKPAVAAKTEADFKTQPQEIGAERTRINVVASAEKEVYPEAPSQIRERLEKYKAKTNAIKEKDLSKKEEKRAIHKEKKKLKKDLRREIKEEVKSLKRKEAVEDDYVIMMILAIIIPPLGVGLTYGLTAEFWISLLLTLIFWLPGAIYSVIVVHQYFR